MDIKEIQNLIKFVAKSGASEVKLELKDIKITVKTYSERTEATFIPQMAPTQIPVSQNANSSDQGETTIAIKEEDTSNLVEIKSPMIGTFYQKPSPDKPNFVEVGDSISESSVVCIIEAMKLFNEIEAEAKGKIVKVLVEDGTPVEYGQPLFLVDPA